MTICLATSSTSSTTMTRKDDEAEGGGRAQASSPQPRPGKDRSSRDKADKPRALAVPNGAPSPPLPATRSANRAAARRRVQAATPPPSPLREGPGRLPDGRRSIDDEPSRMIEAVRGRVERPPRRPPVRRPTIVVHVYEYGKFKRTIPRKFTDEKAVDFAEEYTRTGKAYGRYAIATPDDEEPAPTFAAAAKG